LAAYEGTVIESIYGSPQKSKCKDEDHLSPEINIIQDQEMETLDPNRRLTSKYKVPLSPPKSQQEIASMIEEHG